MPVNPGEDVSQVSRESRHKELTLKIRYAMTKQLM